MGFEELIAMMRNPGEDGIPETIYDDLSASYTELSSTSGAALETANATVAQLQAELTAAKAHNYELMMQTPVAPSDNSVDDESNDDSDSDSDIGDDDDFFEKKED